MVGNSHGSRMSYHRNILLRTNGERRGTDRKPNFVEGEGGWGGGSGERGRDRKPNFATCSAWFVRR